MSIRFIQHRELNFVAQGARRAIAGLDGLPARALPRAHLETKP
jgi:hypothetical protein